jgi:hypothetical protein
MADFEKSTLLVSESKEGYYAMFPSYLSGSHHLSTAVS